MAFRRDTSRVKRGVPVYDESGARFAESVADAARKLGCRPEALRSRHLIDYADGHQLVSRPRTATSAPAQSGQ